MGLRFRKSVQLVPGVRLNVGLRRTSLSIGGKGFTYNVGSNGSRVTVGIPGSGLSYSTSVSHQAPSALMANVVPTRRKYSATPLVVIAFVFGLLYIATHPTPPNTGTASAQASADVTGTIPQANADRSAVMDGPVPLPRPRPKLRSEAIGPPLQLVPQQQ
jgi:Protein of unknown function (DUF4236)